MARSRRRARIPPPVAGLVVLDAEGVSKAASGDPWVRAWLERAHEVDAEIVVSAVTVTEVVRGAARDAPVNLVLRAADVRAVDQPLARDAGRLLGRARSDATIDALVAATARHAFRRVRRTTGCVVLTSDPDDFAALMADDTEFRIISV